MMAHYAEHRNGLRVLQDMLLETREQLHQIKRSTGLLLRQTGEVLVMDNPSDASSCTGRDTTASRSASYVIEEEKVSHPAPETHRPEKVADLLNPV